MTDLYSLGLPSIFSARIDRFWTVKADMIVGIVTF